MLLPDHDERHRDEPGRVHLVLRRDGCRPAGSVRAVGPLRRARHRRQPPRRSALRDGWPGPADRHDRDRRVPLAIVAATVGWTAGVPGMLYLPCWIAASVLPGVPLGLRALADAAWAWATRALPRLRRDQPRLVGGHRGARRHRARRSSSRGWPAAVLLLALARAWRAPALALPAVDTRRHDRALPGAAPRARADGYAVPQPRRCRRRRRTVLSRLLHGRLRVAHGADRGDDPVRDAAAQPVHGRPRAALLLDLLPGARRDERASGPGAVRDVAGRAQGQRDRTAALLLASFYCFAATAVRRRTAAALGVALVVLASSAEGLAVVRDLWLRGRSLVAVRDINVDAVTAWWYDGLRIDGVHRTMYYTPQHGLSCALGLLAVTLSRSAGAAASLPSVVLAGLLLGGATLLNPFLGLASVPSMASPSSPMRSCVIAAPCEPSCRTRSRRFRRYARSAGACPTP